jgi:hypothetical protein
MALGGARDEPGVRFGYSVTHGIRSRFNLERPASAGRSLSITG